MLTAVQTSTDWTGDNEIPLSLFHVWMSLDTGNASLRDRFMAHLDTKFTVRTAREVVDVAYLANKGHLAALLAGGNDGAKLKLALIGVVGSTVNPTCSTYLQGLVDPATQRFPAALNLSAALGGASGENQVLTAIGMGAQATPPNPSSNLRLEGESQNTIHVEPLTEERIAITAMGMEAPVYTRPDRGSTQAGTVPNAGKIHVIGEVNGWLAIEFQYANPDHQGTAFIQASHTL